MSYFGGSSHYAGDPGFFGSMGKLLTGGLKVAGVVAGITPVGRIAKIASTAVKVGSLVAGGTAVAGIAAKLAGGAPPGQLPVPGTEGYIQRLLPGGRTGYYKKRRMQFTNQKALNRAIRRVSGFGNLVKRSKKTIAKANRSLNPTRGTTRSTRKK